jgi:hypothetical protein
VFAGGDFKDGMVGVFWQVLPREEFGLDWFAFTSSIRFGQGRCCGDADATNNDARDVVLGAWQ